ncbi:MAG: beta strand repeat-containing protein [Ferruginibacter sp.]
MKILKLLLLLFVTSFVFKNASAQLTQLATNANINILTANAGVVNLGGVLQLSVSIRNTGSNPIQAQRVRAIISVPDAFGIPLASGSQTLLATNWSILANGDEPGVIVICNNTDVIPANTTRTSIIRISANGLGGPTTISGDLAFGDGLDCSTDLGFLNGDNAADNGSTTTMTVIPAPACSITASATAGTIACNGGTTTLTAASAGGVGSVEYSIDGTNFQASPMFTVPAGTYTVTAREVANPTCTATATPVVIAPVAVVSGTTSTTSASSPASTDGTATVVATGGTGAYSYSWNTTPVQTGATATGLAVGTYTVTITTANGCTGTATATVTAAVCTIAVTASAGTILCNGATTTLTATATGATGAVQYSLNGTTFQASPMFTVPAGTYTVTAREVANTLCTATSSSVVIGQPTALVAAASATAILCNGGNSTVTVSATGGTAPYVASSIGTFTRTAGPYSFTVTDANGCTSVVTGTITQPAAIVVTAAFAPITVFGGTTTVTVSATGGTTPYVPATIGTFTRADGTFTFTVTDANGCTGSTTITINPFSTPVQADPSVGQLFFMTASNALQSANTLMFAPVYRLNVPFFNDQTDIVPNGTIQLRINLGSKLILDPASTLASAPFNTFFAWSSSVVADSVIITGTQIAAIPTDFAAVLAFNVRGELSCTATASARILVVNTAALLIDLDLQNNNAALQYTLPVTLATTQVNVTCNGASNGIINAVASPGSTVVIRNAANAIVSSTGLLPGVYTVTATAIGDAPLSNTCSATTTVTIVQPLVLSAANNPAATVNNVCVGGNNGSLTVVSSGGTAPYTYTIAGPAVNTTGAATGTFTNLLAGSYIVTSTDANGCTAATAAIIITQPTGTAPDVSLGADFSGNFFASTGTSRTIVYNVTEIAGIPAVGDTIRITNPSGFTISFNSSLASSTFGGTTYLLDNSRWKIDNSNPAFTSIILTDPSNAANPGTLLCNERVRVAVTLTRNTTNISTFTLNAVTRRANGETNLLNNRASIIFTAE